MKKIIILAALILTAQCVSAANNFNYQENAYNNFQPNYNNSESFKLNSNTLKGSVITVPAGQSLNGILMAPLSSETSYAGEHITLALGSDFYYNGNKIAPAGSSVLGTIIEVSKAKHGTINGKLTLRFTQIITPSGLTIPISAVVKTNDNTGTLMGGTKFEVATEYAKDVAIGAGTGAVIGTIAGPISGGSIGRGAALMTAVGAGGGLVKSIWDKGSDVEIPANASIEIILTQPITVNPSSFEN
ncbi:hypothetical protein HDR58_06500 [bacterium]|nr:hypothetical protein [bacterium]